MRLVELTTLSGNSIWVNVGIGGERVQVIRTLVGDDDRRATEITLDPGGVVVVRETVQTVIDRIDKVLSGEGER